MLKKIAKAKAALIIIILSIGLTSASNYDSAEQQLVKSKGKERIDLLNTLSREYLKKQPEKSINYSTNALSLSLSSKYYAGIVFAYNNIGSYYLNNKDITLALDNFQKAEQIATDNGIKSELGRTYNNMGNLFLAKKEYEKSLQYHLKALDLREKENDNDEITKSLYNISIVYEKIGKFEEAISYSSRLLKLQERTGPSEDIAKTLGFIGDMHYRLGKYNIALEYYLKEVKYREELKDKNMDRFLSNIGKIYQVMNNFSKAVEYYGKAINTLKDNPDKLRLAKVYTGLGNVYFDASNYEKALECYNKSLKLAEAKGHPKGRAILLNNIGLVYKNMGDFQKANKYCLESLKLRESLGDDNEIFYPLTSLAEINIKLGQYSKTLEYLGRSMDIAKSKNQKSMFEGVYDLYYQCYSAMNNYRDALKYHILYSQLKDTLYNEENNKRFTELQIKYESAKKEHENLSLKKTNEIQKTYFLIISAMAILIGLVFYSRYRNNKKANKILSELNNKIKNQNAELTDLFMQLQKSEVSLLEANATKDKFFSIIAHDLKNPLHSIVLSSDLLLAKYQNMTQEQLQELIQNIQKAGTQLSNLLTNLLQWSRAQMGKLEYEPSDLNLYNLVLENMNLLMPSASKKEINISSSIDNDLTVYADYNLASTVLRNLLSNAVKFTNTGGRVSVSAEKIEDHVYISVRDNGVGINTEDINKIFRIDTHHSTSGTQKESGTGLGLILCREFTEMNGGEIHVESTPGEGTVFTFTLPKDDTVKIEEKTIA